MVWDRLSVIPDPEVPVITILELGVVRAVEWRDPVLYITITPTYSGCPAMTLFVAEIKAAMREAGIDNVEIKTVYTPAWTTDWLSDTAKLKLKQYGIAPPVPYDLDDPLAPLPTIPCPRCDSHNTTLQSQFGSTACKSLYTCVDCKEPFEYFKHF
jgi:ring-1,2-phenylacetyl-CoA epoxidase subunit PaaD